VDALRAIDSWAAGTASAGVVGPGGVLAAYGAVDAELPWASVTKLLTGLALLVAAEEGTVDLDEPAGPPGATLRHLLAHASGLPLDGEEPLAEPGRRRIYSNTGIELAARLLEVRAEMPFGEYFSQAVVQPLGLAGRLVGSPAYGYHGPLDDLLALGRELLAPSLVAPETLAEATTVQFPGLTGVLPGLGRMEPNDWGLAFELRDSKSPHWTGTRNSEGTFGHFGASGTFLWVDRAAGLACLAAAERRRARRGVLVVVGEERPHELIEGRPVAARHDRGGHRRHGRGARDPHRRRDLAEVLAGTKEAAGADVALADREDTGEEHVEAVAGLTLADEDRAGRDLLALHAAREPSQRLARQAREQLDTVELVLRGRRAGRSYSASPSAASLGA
jgi:CubicO group peptidase (beta-lactamase class C family)